MQKETLAIPLAILAAGVIISIGIYVVRSRVPEIPREVSASLVRPVSLSDHIIGSPTATIIFITYSDLECDYCAQWNQTLTQVMSEYAPTGKVAWVWRHFPIPSLYPNALAHAQAAECVYTLKGDSAFFTFVDALAGKETGASAFSLSDYKSLLPLVGVQSDAWENCIAKSTGNARIDSDIENGIAIGIDSTPFTIIQIAGKEPRSISGALPYESAKKLIDESLRLLSEEQATTTRTY